jgi:hypothetical protein
MPISQLGTVTCIAFAASLHAVSAFAAGGDGGSSRLSPRASSSESMVLNDAQMDQVKAGKPIFGGTGIGASGPKACITDIGKCFNVIELNPDPSLFLGCHRTGFGYLCP